MLIDSFEPFVGQHCETTTSGSLLKHAGLELSEPMLFGLGQGLGFVYWDSKAMSLPFLGGRIKQNLLTDNLTRNLCLGLARVETSSVKRAWDAVRVSLDAGTPVGLQVDSYYLDYFTSKVHFGAHFVAMYGYDHADAYLVDTAEQGTLVSAPLTSVASARNARGPMTSRNLSYTITAAERPESVAVAVRRAIAANAADFLNPPIQNLGHRGITKAAREVENWFARSREPGRDLTLAAALMERAGTGGALFRNLYRDFLGECATLMDDERLDDAHLRYSEIASLWTQVASQIHDAGVTRHQRHLDEASRTLDAISAKEKEAMEVLARDLV